MVRGMPRTVAGSVKAWSGLLKNQWDPQKMTPQKLKLHAVIICGIPQSYLTGALALKSFVLT